MLLLSVIPLNLHKIAYQALEGSMTKSLLLLVTLFAAAHSAAMVQYFYDFILTALVLLSSPIPTP